MLYLYRGERVKKSIYLICIVVLVLMLIPKVISYKDGGSKEYRAILYSVTKHHMISENSTNGYIDGLKIKVLGITLYDNIKNKENKSNEDLVSNGVTLSIKDEAFSSITIIIKNNTQDIYVYGPEYSIEKLEEGNWIECDTINGYPLTWNSVEYILNSDEEKEEILDLTLSYGKLSKGKYRVIKYVFKNNNGVITNDKSEKLIAEFEIK